MTYFGVLLTFVAPPLLVLMALVPHDLWRWLVKGQGRVNWKPYLILLTHVALALLYTTPWDNYLVATGVWWYDSDLVTGITLGWVPIEEYTFFVIQTLLAGLWALALTRYVFTPPPQVTPSEAIRRRASATVITLWAVSTLTLLLGWGPGTYLALILSWALIPVLIQVAFGADILLANWRVLAATIVPPTLYLWLVDALAMANGTWAIDPAQTTGVKLGVLPLEEMVFFLMTNLIIGFGVILMLSGASRERTRAIRTRIEDLLGFEQEHRYSSRARGHTEKI